MGGAELPAALGGGVGTEAELVTTPDKRPVSSPMPAGLWGRSAPYLAVGAGAAIGANLRHLVGLWVAARWAGAFPWGTLLINLTGSFTLGLFLALLVARRVEVPLVRLFLATGLLGAYTTFSTFSAETVALLGAGRVAPAAAYVTLSLVGGIGAARAGITCARRGRG